LAAVGGAEAADSKFVQQASAAYEALSSGDTAKAIAGYSEAIESKELPTDVLANALLNRALAYQRTGQYQDAIDDYAAALRLDTLAPKLRATALYNRGLAYQKVSRPTLAIEDFTSALFLDSEFSYCYYSRGVALRDSGQYLFALSDFEKARRYNHPQPYLVYYGEALVFEALKRPDDATKSLRKALALKPDFEPARQHLSSLGETAPPPSALEPAEDADKLTTGSISTASAGQVYVKQELPPAVKPPASLSPAVESVAEAAAETPPNGDRPSKKKYVDRIPQEQPGSVKLASTRVEEPPAEKLVAIEKVPESKAPAAEAAAPGVAQDEASEPPATAALTETASVEPVANSTAVHAEPAGWSVQLSSAKDEKLAWGIWDKLKARHKVLANENPIVVRADLGAKGIFYRLRLAGFEDSKSASSVCSKLKSKGLKCFVSRASS
jgi:tetratricopeptide (TPR) repeat protein